MLTLPFTIILLGLARLQVIKRHIQCQITGVDILFLPNQTFSSLHITGTHITSPECQLMKLDMAIPVLREFDGKTSVIDILVLSTFLMVDINHPQNPYTLIFFFFERRPQADLRPTAIRWFDLAGIAKDGINEIAVVFLSHRIIGANKGKILGEVVL
jgi:hypothetical protein